MKDCFLEGKNSKSIRSVCFKNCTFSNTTAPKNCHNSNLLMMQDFLTSTSNARAHNVVNCFTKSKMNFYYVHEIFFLFLILKIEKKGEILNVGLHKKKLWPHCGSVSEQALPGWVSSIFVMDSGDWWTLQNCFVFHTF